MLAYFVNTQKLNRTLNLVLSIPSLILFVPFIIMFPIGLGLKILTGSAILTVLVFGLLLPVLGSFPKKSVWVLALFLISMGFFAKAHFNSNYAKGTAKPNSLLYIYNADSNKAVWATYDLNLDEWTKMYLGDNPKEAGILNDNPLFSKYKSGFTFSAEADVKEISEPTIAFFQDSIGGSQRYIKIRISPNRNVNRYDIFANEKMVFYNLKANGATALAQKGSLYLRNGKKLVSYYVVDNEPLELQFSIPSNTTFDMDLMESSFDLLTNPKFRIAKRLPWMMPMPFVLNDAVVIQKKIIPSIVISKTKNYRLNSLIAKDSLTVISDSIKAIK
jgi:hypothetical protein